MEGTRLCCVLFTLFIVAPESVYEWDGSHTFQITSMTSLYYGMGPRKLLRSNRWKQARKALLQKERWDDRRES